MERRVASDVDPDSVMDQQARPSSEAAEEALQVVHEDALRSLKNKRKAKLEQLLRQRSKIHQFMDEECYSVVEDRMLPAFYQLLKELCDINDSLKETYQERKLEDDMKIDQDWFDTRLSVLRGRGDDIACRLTEVRQRREEARKANESVAPEDSVCLKSGHMSRHCQEVVNCQLCSGTHNTLLHVKPKERQSVDRDNLAVFNGLVNSKRKQNFDDMPKNTECILAIIPVRVKAKKGNKVITLYAFLDPGSTATFCTDELLDELNLRGKKVSLIVTTMTESKVVTSTMVTELEVGHLNSNTFIELKEVFSQKAIPVSRNNIPRQEDIDKWPHLKGVQVPLIDAAIGLLIGTDAAKMMEPKEVIPSVDDGPFAVRTILGWTVNGPLKVDGCNTSRNEIMQAVSNRVSVARLEDSVYWTDSTAVLKYISNETSRFRTFVANRVSAIQQTSTVSQWHYVNSHLNPADGASRGQKVKAFLRNKLWVSGPDFLTQAVGNWPRNPDSQEIDLDVADPEVKRNVTVNVLAVEESTDIVQRLMEYYSSWTRLKRAVAWFLRLKDMLLTSSRRRKGLLQNTVQNIQLRRKELNYKTRKKNLTVDELKEAEVDIIRHCQRKSFPDEISSLLKGEAVKRSSHIHRLNPVLQDGILRVGGRLSKAAMPEESKHPAILAKNHRVSQLILQDIHERIGHGGRNHVLSTLRQRYWIPNAISAIRKILSSCRTCRRLHGATGRQQMADLPLSRVLPDEPPFTRTGVDCFGPFTIKRGRTTAKRYGVIFTCMATRAVHIEVAASLDTDSFINALRRFIARRGQVLEIHSDNGTNFVGAEGELKRSLEEWNMSKIENRLTQSGIKWMFNPPSASHFGGVWERLIRSVRKVLSATLKDQSLDEEGLQTLLCEVEAILNSRPITTPSDDPNDLEALTPNHLLLLKTQPSIPQGVFQEDDLYSRRRWRQVQYMADLFWKRWVKEYLPELQRRQKWTHAKRNFVPGDIVLIVDESAPRNSWVIGRIIHAIQDERGLVRQVRIKTRTNEFDRPITKVCLLQESE
ncbi:hypothetical protein Q8A73_000064 [Channa argus]|nr:hypothetical protein Q8A73_000064 [Channa argus]